MAKETYFRRKSRLQFLSCRCSLPECYCIYICTRVYIFSYNVLEVNAYICVCLRMYMCIDNSWYAHKRYNYKYSNQFRRKWCLRELVAQGICCYKQKEGEHDCIWGFKVLQVDNPLAFNKAFRVLAPQRNINNPRKQPTEVFLSSFRAWGVTARRGARGPIETDPDSKDYMYSYY